MMKIIKAIAILSLLSLGACNKVTLKPGIMEPGTKVSVQPGGATMKRAIKDVLEQRGYSVEVGKLAGGKKADDLIKADKYYVSPDIRYVVRVQESGEKMRALWCSLNGFWWWKFTVSITDQQTKKEILAWRGRGCANSSLRKLNRILDDLEQHD